MKILTIAEQKENQLSNISFEPIGVAKSLGGEISTALICGTPGDMPDKLAAKGGKVFVFAHDKLGHFHDEAYTRILFHLVEREKPDVIIGLATFYGKALMARLAALLGASMASDCTALTKEGEAIVAVRPTYGGNVFLKVAASGAGPLVVTTRPKAFAEAADDGSGEVVNESVDESWVETRTSITERVADTGGAVSLTEADIIVAGGRGIRAAENFKLIQDLAKTLGAAVGASRAIVDAGWVPYSYQVGQTGKTVNPKLYFAVGISGAVQHLVGMRSSKTIVAINRDKDAPIFNMANYGIVGDLFEIMPALTAKFKEIM